MSAHLDDLPPAAHAAARPVPARRRWPRGSAGSPSASASSKLLAPAAVCRATGLRGRTKLVRAYGLREIATGVAILASHDPTPWIWGRIGGDAMDLATLVADLDSDNPRRGKVIAALAVASGVALLDALCVQELHDEQASLSRRAQYALSRPGRAFHGRRAP